MNPVLKTEPPAKASRQRRWQKEIQAERSEAEVQISIDGTCYEAEPSTIAAILEAMKRTYQPINEQLNCS